MNRMHRRDFIKAAGVGLAASLAGQTGYGESAARSRPPNILIVLADDQGYGDLSCHGNPVLQTPHLDAWHAASARLTNFHAAPMCTPTRGQLLTGLDALRNGAFATCLGRQYLREGLPTLPAILKNRGFETGLFGKWHLGSHYPHRPMDRGFDEAIYHQGWGLTSAEDRWCNDYFDPWYLDNGRPRQASGYCTEFWFDQAMSWMRRQSKRDRPFFCLLATNVIHSPHWVSDEFRKPYEALSGKKEELDAYYGMAANLDANVGRLETMLRETGLSQNTILIYLTDNGTTLGRFVYNAGMREGKTSLYDGGHRVPCFIRWPGGGLPAGVDIPALTQVQDLLPTLLDLTGVSAPEGMACDGLSLAPLLRGEAEAATRLRSRMAVVQIHHTKLARDEAAVLWNDWRLVRRNELYHLADDPGQTHNVIAQNPEIAERMAEFYDRWWGAVEPRLAEYVPNHIGSRQDPSVTLSSSDWAGVRADGAGSVRLASSKPDSPQGGPWHLLVERGGPYTIELRRWPREANVPLDAGVPPFVPRHGNPLVEGVALPITGAVLRIADQQMIEQIPHNSRCIRFRVRLMSGRTQMQAWFTDNQNQPVCGAYYAYVTRA